MAADAGRGGARPGEFRRSRETRPLVATFIVLEAPLSGMSMNPARTLGSAVYAGTWRALCVYVTAPALGMLLAAEVYRALKGAASVRCAKLQHAGGSRCIFRCGYATPVAGAEGRSSVG
jgi:aquaporin Z